MLKSNSFRFLTCIWLLVLAFYNTFLLLYPGEERAPEDRCSVHSGHHATLTSSRTRPLDMLCQSIQIFVEGKKRRKTRYTLQVFLFPPCQKPVVFIVWAGNVTRKSWMFGIVFMFFSWPLKPRLVMPEVHKISIFEAKLWNLVLSCLHELYSQLF